MIACTSLVCRITYITVVPLFACHVGKAQHTKLQPRRQTSYVGRMNFDCSTLKDVVERSPSKAKGISIVVSDMICSISVRGMERMRKKEQLRVKIQPIYSDVVVLGS